MDECGTELRPSRRPWSRGGVHTRAVDDGYTTRVLRSGHLNVPLNVRIVCSERVCVILKFCKLTGFAGKQPNYGHLVVACERDLLELSACELQVKRH